MKMINKIAVLLPLSLFLASCTSSSERARLVSYYALSDSYLTLEGTYLESAEDWISFRCESSLSSTDSSASMKTSEVVGISLIPKIRAEILSRGFFDHVAYGDSVIFTLSKDEVLGESSFRPAVAFSADGKDYLEFALGQKYLLSYVQDDLK